MQVTNKKQVETQVRLKQKATMLQAQKEQLLLTSGLETADVSQTLC